MADPVTVAIWLAARIRCAVFGHRMTQHGRLEQCGATFWDLGVDL